MLSFGPIEPLKKSKIQHSGHWAVVVGDTRSDSIQYLNFAKKNDSFNIWLNIALPKIQFEILFNSKDNSI